MDAKVKTVDLKGKAYAQVKDRLKEFREANPNGLIETFPTITETSLIFKARILTDKSNPDSAEATGHSFVTLAKAGSAEKQFEKQETIAVGRALALLGYAVDGEIASSEEMEAFRADKRERTDKEIEAATEKLRACKTTPALQKVWAGLSAEAKKALEAVKDEMKAVITDATKPA